MKPVLVTGARGFIGQHLTRYLVAQEKQVVGIGHGSLPHAQIGELGLAGWVNGDLDFTNLQLLSNQFGDFETVFHLAGGSHVGRSFENPAEDFQRTVNAGSQLLEWVRLNHADTPLVVVSSAAVYGAGHDQPITEDAVTNPFSPYGAHKYLLEQLCRSYGKNFGLKIAITRLFSVYGEGLEKQLIFDLCRKLQADPTKIALGGSGDETRDWIHVSDVARLLTMLPKHCSTDCLTVNGASGNGLSVRGVAEQLVEAWGEDTKIEFSGAGRRGDPVALVADASRLKNDIGFNVEIDTPKGFAQVVDWYRKTWGQA